MVRVLCSMIIKNGLPARAVFPLCLLPLLAGCAAGGEDKVPSRLEAASEQRAAPTVYQCGDRLALARFEGRDVLLQLPPAPPRRLSTTLSASGARYAGGGVVFWTKRDEAILEVAGEARRQCRRQDAPIRAAGQEPGWLLEIVPGGRMAFTGDYGEIRVSAPTPTPEMPPGGDRTVYRAGMEAGDLTAVFEERPCRDAMSGRPYPSTVTVTLGGREYGGCGDAVPPA